MTATALQLHCMALRLHCMQLHPPYGGAVLQCRRPVHQPSRTV